MAGLFSIGVVIDEKNIFDFKKVHEDIDRHIVGIKEFIEEYYFQQTLTNKNNMHLDYIIVKTIWESNKSTPATYNTKGMKYVRNCECINYNIIDFTPIMTNSSNVLSTNSYSYNEYSHKIIYDGETWEYNQGDSYYY